MSHARNWSPQLASIISIDSFISFPFSLLSSDNTI
jgi:hypothetical protein